MGHYTKDITALKPDIMPAPQTSQQVLISNIVAAANKISNDKRKGSANYITIPIENLQAVANKLNVDIDEAVELVREYFKCEIIKENGK